MSVHFLASALDRWDDADAGALVLTFFADERPLRGAAGLADWRLCGRLSRLIKRGKIQGQRGETLLMPPGQRLGFPRVLLFGLGSSASFDEAGFRKHVRWIRGVLRRAGVSSYAIQPPGRATGLIAARRALELWIEEADLESRDDEDVAIIDAPGAQKEMAEILRKAQKQRPSSRAKGAAPPGAGAAAKQQASGAGSKKAPQKTPPTPDKAMSPQALEPGAAGGSEPTKPPTAPPTTAPPNGAPAGGEPASSGGDGAGKARPGGRPLRAAAVAAGSRAGTSDDAWD